ncbi:MAG: hypothetical protein JSS56_22780 [Proteobacteria bacterium]|nr:hypothetical protein [Pseudomonadota bacterium]
MDASQLFGTIIRILNQPVFPPRAKPALAGNAHPGQSARPRSDIQASARAQVARPTVPTGLVPITVEPMMAGPDSTATSANASSQAMRTLEEVRADLARLREQARSRHAAHVQQRRDLGFAPTDFMEYGKPASAAGSAAGFPPTDFMDMGGGKLS